MEKELIVNIIKDELEKKGIKVTRIILFGSRATNNARDDSDWDIFVIVDKELEFKEMKDLVTVIKRKLAMMKIPNDIIIRSQRQFEENKEVVGYISYYVSKEGIEI